MFRKRPFRILIGLLILSITIMLVLPRIATRKIGTPSELCKEVMTGLRFSLDRYYRNYKKYPSGKGDEFFRQLERATICPVRAVENTMEQEDGEFNERIDYETWPDGLSKEILSDPPDGYPILWDKKGNHKDNNRNILILSHAYVTPLPNNTSTKCGPLEKYVIFFLTQSENEFVEYIKRFSNTKEIK